MSYNERWVENEAYQQMTLLVVQSVDKQLVVLEQESCAKLRTTSGVKRRRISRQSCTWKIFVLHAPSPTADIHILAKTWHQQQDIVRMTKNTLIIIILSLRTWIHFYDVNLSILSTLCQQWRKQKSSKSSFLSLCIRLPTRFPEWVFISVAICVCVVNLRYAVWR